MKMDWFFYVGNIYKFVYSFQKNALVTKLKIYIAIIKMSIPTGAVFRYGKRVSHSMIGCISQCYIGSPCFLTPTAGYRGQRVIGVISRATRRHGRHAYDMLCS